MKEINNVDLDLCKEIASLTQDTWQYDNCNVALYRVGKSTIYVEDTVSDSTHFLLDADESSIAPKEFLEDCVREWAGNTDNQELELVAWGLTDPADLQVDNDFEGKCKILRRGMFACYYPVSYEQYELTNEDYIFESVSAAKRYIDKLNNKTYYLSHGEQGRPELYIVECN